jgi:hypothetical protein
LSVPLVHGSAARQAAYRQSQPLAADLEMLRGDLMRAAAGE